MKQLTFDDVSLLPHLRKKHFEKLLVIPLDLFKITIAVSDEIYFKFLLKLLRVRNKRAKYTVKVKNNSRFFRILPENF